MIIGRKLRLPIKALFSAGFLLVGHALHGHGPIVMDVPAARTADEYAVFRRVKSFQPDHAIDDTAIRLTKVIRPTLPRGWTTSYDRKHRWLEVRRKRLVCGTWGSNVPGDSCEQYVLALRPETLMSAQQYRLLSTENADVSKRLVKEKQALYKVQFKDFFIPHTDSEHRRVEHYNQLESTLHHLPDFRFQNISLSWVLEERVHDMDENVGQECNSMKEKLVGLLERYP